jgi:nucleoid-associated protein YgaU
MSKSDISNKEKKRMSQPTSLKKVSSSESSDINERLEAQKQPTFESPQQAVENKFIYKVKVGDTLGALAKEFYGDENQWSRIYRANKGMKGVNENPNDVLEMVDLVVPRT